MVDNYQAYLNRGLIVSICGHVILLLSFLLKFHSEVGEIRPQEIYSISIEGGKTLGGREEIEKRDQKSPDLEQKYDLKEKEAKNQQIDDQKQKEHLENNKDEAELNLLEKPTPTPKPAPTATPRPKPTISPTPLPKVVATPLNSQKTAETKKGSEADLDKKLQQALKKYKIESTQAGGQGIGAGALTGGKGYGGGIVRPPEFFEYKRRLEAAIKSGWHWFDRSQNLIAQIEFSISPRGDISDIKLAASSGNSDFDTSALRAVEKASPVPSPPPIVYEFFKRVRMTFDPRE
ncbi:MAG TPA: TonB family protein [Oligoflexia bacterium]|mgnify:CR=1 FL=1|nr:TonB family protein [Oligoflexia bacterium]HMP27037.1 TonB family protein [Oligoflexia bacterium]